MSILDMIQIFDEGESIGWDLRGGIGGRDKI